MIDTSPDFIMCRKYRYSLKTMINSAKAQIPDHMVARVMGMTESQLRMLWAQTTSCLRKLLRVS